MSRRGTLAVALTMTTVLVLSLTSGRAAPCQEPTQRRKVMKTDEQWARLLTTEQFLVTRRKATENAFSGKYAVHHARGTYQCVCCGAELFASTAKFDSGTGWPSFFRPIDPKRIDSAPDYHLAEPRVEVMCMDCGAHLGHVFNDGPPPTGLRFCINSASLKFKPAVGTKEVTTSKSRRKSSPKAKGGDSPRTATPKDAPPAEGTPPAEAPKSEPGAKDPSGK